MFLETKIPYTKFSRFEAFNRVMKPKPESKYRRKWLIALAILFVIILFLPWTQNIQSNGEVSTLNPQQRPQQINSIIAGRIEKWYVKDGDFVNKGDTLARITEIKDGYLDPSQLVRVN